MMTMSRWFQTAVALVALAGCREEAADAGGASEEASPAQATAPTESDRESAQLIAHADSVAGMRGEQFQSMLGLHRQIVGNALADMNADMRSMSMATDATWNALVDSLRADVVALPEMGMAELETAMPDHLGRFRRLVESHRAMMRAMGM